MEVQFLNKGLKNIFAALSIWAVVVGIIFIFIINKPNINLTLVITELTLISISGIIFAILSKKRWFIITGIILNGGVLVFTYFLLLAVGIGEA